MHTKEPWHVRVGERDNQEQADMRICGDIFVIARIDGPQYAHCHPNAERIVSCVNALAGLNPDAVADVVAALQACHSTLEHTRAFMLQKHGTTNPAREEALALARTALARIRGEG